MSPALKATASKPQSLTFDSFLHQVPHSAPSCPAGYGFPPFTLLGSFTGARGPA